MRALRGLTRQATIDASGLSGAQVQEGECPPNTLAEFWELEAARISIAKIENKDSAAKVIFNVKGGAMRFLPTKTEQSLMSF